MQVISMTDEAFYALLNKLTAEIKAQQSGKPDKWVDGEEAMRMLRISSKTTLQKLRDNGEIRFSQPMPKHLLYDTDSIMAYIEKHARNTF